MWLDAALGTLIAVLGTLSLWLPPTSVTVDFREPDVLGVALVLLAGAGVAVRTRWPVPAFACTTAGALTLLLLGHPQSVVTFAPLLGLYTVAVLRPGRVSVPASVVLYLLVGVVLVAGPVRPTLADWVSNTVVVLTVWAIGRSVRSRRAETAGREQRDRALFEAREARARAAELDERAAIAREMHDLVTHGMTQLTVQTAAARRLLRSDPDTAERLLLEVEHSGRGAVAEMRRVLGVLRSPGTRAELEPQPGLAELDDLVASRRAEGLAVELRGVGAPAEVDRGVQLTAYRIVEESLDNVGRHAGRATARVLLDWRPGRLCLTVEDDGRGASAMLPVERPAGHGLHSLRERVAAYGGTLRAGPRPGGGFAVTADLPTTSRSRP